MTAERYQKLTLSLTQGKPTNFPSTLQRKKRGCPHAENGFPKIGSAQRAARCPPTKITIQFRKPCLPFPKSKSFICSRSQFATHRTSTAIYTAPTPDAPREKIPARFIFGYCGSFFIFPVSTAPPSDIHFKQSKHILKNTFAYIISRCLFFVKFYAKRFHPNA